MIDIHDIENLSREELIELNKNLLYKNQDLQFQLNQLQRAVYGTKSERFIAEPPEQMQLALEEDENQRAPEVERQKIEYERKKPKKKNRKPARKPLPDYLRREVTVIEPEGDMSGRKMIGREVTEYLEYTPGEMYVVRIERLKYADPENEENGIAIADLPSRLIPKGMAGPGLLSQCIVDKYVDHLPLYRQVQRFKRHEIPLARSTLGDWVKQCAQILDVLYQSLVQRALSTSYLQVDESAIPVLSKNKPGSTVKGCMLVQYAPNDNLAVFSYTKTKEKVNLADHLEKFRGHLQADGNVSYESIASKEGVTLVNCWVHARRKFEAAQDNDQDRATYVLQQIQLLYNIEREITQLNLSSAEKRQRRQTDSTKILADLKHWLTDQFVLVLPQSPIRKAINYTLKRWKPLTEYLNHGHLLMDNNLVENTIRPLALGRKNYLFAGSHDAAYRTAIFYSFFATCKCNNIEPFAWLRDVLS